MAARHMPKTLAKTLAYIACLSPGEYGLFWDPDGTMPWKELYWALQEDAALRFVKETHLKELAYLGIELPFFLDGPLLRLHKDSPPPVYPFTEPPERLYHAIPIKSFARVSAHGLSPRGNRPFLRLTPTREMALRLAKRRDPEPAAIEVSARKAGLAGAQFRMVGAELFLVEAIAPDFLVMPPLRQEDLSRAASKNKGKSSGQAEPAPAPGSFLLGTGRSRKGSPEWAGAAAGAGKGEKSRAEKKDRDWKRHAREERRKREI
jgi:putative RNA 2'-phosphotransferase